MSVWRYIHVSKSVHRDQERDRERERKRESTQTLPMPKNLIKTPVNAAKQSGKCSEEFVVAGESHQILKKKGCSKLSFLLQLGLPFFALYF